MDKVIVTGGAGFIGSHLVETLVKDHFVIVIDDLSTGKRENIPLHLSNIELLVMDCCDVETFIISRKYRSEFFKGIKTVYHLAANSDISKADANIEYDKTFLSTFAMLKLCDNLNIPEFVFTSSGAVYGPDPVSSLKHTENDRLAPISHYAAAKAASEAFISSFAKMYGIKSLILRLPNVIGPRMSHGIIYDFINKLKQNPDKLEVLGNGLQAKPYMHVNEIINAIIYLTALNYDIETFNIAPLSQKMAREIAEMVIEEMGLEAKIKYTGGESGWPGDVPLYRPLNRKMLSTGFTYKLDSTAAIKTVIKEML